MSSPIRLPRPTLLSPDLLGRLHEAALKILETIGLRVLAPEAVQVAHRLRLSMTGDRVLFDPNLVEDFVAETRSAGGGEQEGPEPERKITLGVCQYATHVHDIDTDQVVPFTTERLIEAAKFLDTLHPFGVIGKTPGAPMDVPPAIQSLTKYYIQALHCRHGRGPVELTSPPSVPFIMDMAEALGHPITSTEIYVVSPLTIGGESFNCALAGRDRLKGVWVSNMSSLGATAPIGLGDALALGVAEVVGAAILAREVVGLPVGWSIRVCPFEPRAMALSLGGPEELPLQWACDEVNAWYHNRPLGPPWGALHSQAKRPDAQAAAERMAMMVTHALFGARVFTGIGRLSLDEVFSAEQAVIDLEIRDHVHRLIQGVAIECQPEACVAEVKAGITEGFLGLDATAATYQQLYWRPRLFWRGMLPEWLRVGAPDLRQRAKEMVRTQLKKHDYQLALDLRREVERIYARAERALAA